MRIGLRWGLPEQRVHLEPDIRVVQQGRKRRCKLFLLRTGLGGFAVAENRFLECNSGTSLDGADGKIKFLSWRGRNAFLGDDADDSFFRRLQVVGGRVCSAQQF